MRADERIEPAIMVEDREGQKLLRQEEVVVSYCTLESIMVVVLVCVCVCAHDVGDDGSVTGSARPCVTCPGDRSVLN